MAQLKNYNFSANLHIFSIKGNDFILDVNSGAVHRLDPIARQYLKKLIETDGDWERVDMVLGAEYSTEVIAETRQEIEDVAAQDGLFTSDDGEMENFDYGFGVPKAICLNVAHLCNMRCAYCFAKQGSFGEETGLMSQETAKQAIDFLINASQGRKHLELDFFGGEPLLNLSVVSETVRYARDKAAQAGKEFSFTLTTNGLKLDADVQKYLIKEGLAVILSLDGRPQVNDHMRQLPNGQGTYDLILPEFKSIVAMNPTSYYVRGTFTSKNLDFVEDFKHMVELGFENISLEPVTGGDAELALTEEHLPLIFSQYEELAASLLDYHRQGKSVNFFHFNLDLSRGPCLSKRMTGCGAGVEYLAITPTGDIYPCHQFIGNPQFKMGKVDSPGLNEELVRQFAGNTLASKKCQSCWARFYCGGGCHAAAYFENGSMAIPNDLTCRMHKKRLECSFYLASEKLGGEGN
ncbi:MAG: thioether cross-link-forming SCIFF peptide maturase [Ignavibacteriales bacterium]